MCILFIYTDPNPPKGGYRLIIASNRDEYYNRPAKSAFHCQQTDIIGGRDLTEGGMWLGISTKGDKMKFGAILNVTGEEKKPSSPSRGHLVLNYLKSDKSPTDYVGQLQINSYNAFNLVTIEIAKSESSVHFHSNSPEAAHEYRGRQILGFGNSSPDAPFTKVQTGRTEFEEAIAETHCKDILVEKLLRILKCERKHLPDPELERRAPAALPFLSSICVQVKNINYGTRTHSIVLVDEDCNIEFMEHTKAEPVGSENPQWSIAVIKAHL